MKGVGFLLVFLALSTTAFAFNQPAELKGIRTVNVMIADLSDDLIGDGVDKEALRTTLERALSSAGIAVLSRDRFDDAIPTVALRVSEIKEPNGRFYAATIALACLDNVSNGRISIPFSAAIWARDVLLLLGRVDLSRVVGGEKQLVDLFLNDYQEANPG